MPTRTVHPARFSDSILAEVDRLLDRYLPKGGLILDPFAGTGRVHELASLDRHTTGVEIEPEWAGLHPRTIVGNALELPFGAASFDAVVTSPCYGNRMADHHRARDGSIRHTYTHIIQRISGDPDRQLNPDNAGLLQWGDRYRDFHSKAWGEVRRVLRDQGLVFLNVSNHIRKFVEVPVVAWHLSEFDRLGFDLLDQVSVFTQRQRHGSNRDARAATETIAVLAKRSTG